MWLRKRQRRSSRADLGAWVFSNQRTPLTDSRRPTPSNQDIAAALKRHLQRTYEVQEAHKPPPLIEQVGSSMRPCEPSECPFPQQLLTRDYGFTGIPLTDQEVTRCHKAREQTTGAGIERATVLCSPAPVALPAGTRAAYRTELWHVELLVDGQRVHVESIVQQLAGPGGINKEIRIYVDGVLNGRSHMLGRLGASVMWSPVVASVGPDLVLIVTPVHFGRFDELIVELRR
jgi:hypothetical protein